MKREIAVIAMHHCLVLYYGAAPGTPALYIRPYIVLWCVRPITLHAQGQTPYVRYKNAFWSFKLILFGTHCKPPSCVTTALLGVLWQYSFVHYNNPP